MKKIVIIGNGITGTTVARNIRKLSDYEITIVSSESEHFFSRTALMYIYMGHMKYEHTKPYEDWFWEKNRINLIKGEVQKIDFKEKTLLLSENNTIKYDSLVIASGSVSNKFGWPGQDLKGVQGLYNLQDVSTMETSTKNIKQAVIVGGGLIGIEMAEMLHSRHIPVTFLVRESKYWNNVLPDQEAEMIGRHIISQGIDLRLQSELKEIIGDENGVVQSIVTGSGEKIACQFVGLTAGVSPNIKFLKNTDLETDRGILVNEFLETNIENVYSAGDCAEFRSPLPDHPKVEQLWCTGKMQAEMLARTICGNRSAYQRGIWFNSAKFFDIEYQTYGMVFNKPRESEKTFYWEHADGQKCFRMIYNSEEEIIGFNFFGIRYKQTVADSFIRTKTNINDVIDRLSEGFFDPEFFESYHKPIKNAFVEFCNSTKIKSIY